jgi:hypothetical protein
VRGDASTGGPRDGCGPAPAEVRSARAMLILSDEATGQTLALLATFVGIGVLVSILVAYIVGQVFAEHKQNQEREREI